MGTGRRYRCRWNHPPTVNSIHLATTSTFDGAIVLTSCKIETLRPYSKGTVPTPWKNYPTHCNFEYACYVLCPMRPRQSNHYHWMPLRDASCSPRYANSFRFYILNDPLILVKIVLYQLVHTTRQDRINISLVGGGGACDSGVYRNEVVSIVTVEAQFSQISSVHPRVVATANFRFGALSFSPRCTEISVAGNLSWKRKHKYYAESTVINLRPREGRGGLLTIGRFWLQAQRLWSLVNGAWPNLTHS